MNRALLLLIWMLRHSSAILSFATRSPNAEAARMDGHLVSASTARARAAGAAGRRGERPSPLGTPSCLLRPCPQRAGWGCPDDPHFSPEAPRPYPHPHSGWPLPRRRAAAMAKLDFSKLLDTNLNTPQIIVASLVFLYVVGGFCFVLNAKQNKNKKAKAD